MSRKERLDVLLVESGLVQSRERAKARIMAGQVLVDGRRVDKPGTRIGAEQSLRLLGEDMPYVSRGGLKLEQAIKRFQLDFCGKNVLDVGASTGGFTDCALKHGAAGVFAVDVGYGQLAWELRCDPRVTNLERTNARFLSLKDLGRQVEVATIDTAFISLEKVLPAIFPLVTDEGEIVALIKPQFEAGRTQVGKKGVVREPEIHRAVIEAVAAFVISAGWLTVNLAPSPIKGPEGNIEFLILLKQHGRQIPATRIEEVVEEAWNSLQEL